MMISPAARRISARTSGSALPSLRPAALGKTARRGLTRHSGVTFAGSANSIQSGDDTFVTRQRSKAGALLSDEQVVARVLAGQTALFEVLMRRHNERLYRAARAILRDENEAEDVMQQAYVNAYSHLRQFDGRSKFSTWLTRSRCTRRWQELDGAADTRPWIPRTLVDRIPRGTRRTARSRAPCHLSRARRIGRGCNRSSPDGMQKYSSCGKSRACRTDEVAEALSVSEDVVKTRLSRARGALRRELFEQAGLAASDTFRFLRAEMRPRRAGPSSRASS